MNILIIGGTGLISTAITRQLLARGDQVTLFNRGKSEERFPAGVRRIQGDRRDYPKFVQQVREAGHFDCVVEMICYTPEDAQSLVDAFAGRTGHLVFCSTVDTYVRPTQHFPISENEPRGGLSDYGKNKVRCEEILLKAHARGDFPATVIRPAQTYGEGGVLVHSLGWGTDYLDRICKGKPIIVHGDGQSLWVALHIDDCARAFVGAIGNQKAFGKCYNVTGDDWMTWDRYNETVAAAIGVKPPEIIHIPTDLLVRVSDAALICKLNFQFSNIFDNSAAKNDLGYQHTISFLEGARRTYQWLESRNRIEPCEKSPFYDQIIQAWRQLGDGMAAALAQPK